MIIKEAMFYECSDELVHCMLCPHDCKITDGNTGICGVRRNRGGSLIAESYGLVTSLALDPIEKKPLYHFFPGSMILSVGSYGCNFHCAFCQNYSISLERPETRFVSPITIASKAAELSGEGNIGVAYTYNEPLIGYEFVLDCCENVRSLGMKNVIVTNGFIQQDPLLNLLPYTDAMNIDLKSADEGFYKKLCGGSVQEVWNTIRIAAEHCHVEVTTLIITGENDTEEEMDDIARKLSEISPDIPLHISRFFPMYKMRALDATPVNTIYSLAEAAKRRLKHVYLGNI